MPTAPARCAACAPARAKVYATAKDGSGVRGEITVTVVVPVTSFYIPDSEHLFVGKTVTLRPNGTPGNATYRYSRRLHLGDQRREHRHR